MSTIIGDETLRWEPVSGGFSSAGLWVIETSGGDRRFVKAATSEDTARFLRAEMVVYNQIDAAFMPDVISWIDDRLEPPFLILEDLSRFRWPPPWSSADIAGVRSVCGAIAATPPPRGLSNEAASSLAEPYWPAIAAHPEPIHALGVTSREWLDRALPRLVEAEQGAVVDGDSLVHADIRSDNLCIGDRVKVIDWNWAFVGNPMIDVVAWLPSLHLEGGPPPWELLQGEAGLVARLAGFFLQDATKPIAPDVRSDIRRFQRAQGNGLKATGSRQRAQGNGLKAPWVSLGRPASWGWKCRASRRLRVPDAGRLPFALVSHSSGGRTCRWWAGCILW